MNNYDSIESDIDNILNCKKRIYTKDEAKIILLMLILTIS